MEPRQDRRGDAAVLALLFIAVTLFHWRGIRPGYTFLPVDLAGNNLPWRGEQWLPLQNWLISDPLYQYYPFLEHALQAVRAWRWPLWNPSIMLGHPALADPLGQPFYPLALLAGLLFGAARGLAVAYWLQALLAAGLAYGWLRHGQRRPVAAAGGALTYALSGYLVTWFETTFWLSTLSLLPGILWAFDAAVVQHRRRYLGVAGLLFGLAILGGQYSFMGTFTIFLGLYAVGRWLATRRQREPGSSRWLQAFAVVVPTGILIGAVSVLPFSELLGLSRRVVGQGLNDPLPWQQFASLLVPNFFGNPATDLGYWGSENYSGNTIHAGLVALWLAALAPWAERRFFVRYVALLVLVAIYAIGGGPGVSLLAAVPGIKYISLHRSAFILPLLIAYLATTTLQARLIGLRILLLSALAIVAVILLLLFGDVGEALSHLDALQGEIGRALGLLLLALLLLGSRQRLPGQEGTLAWLLVGLLFLDLYTFGSNYNPVGKVAELMPPTPAIEYLRAAPTRQRLLSLQRHEQILFGPNVSSIFGIPEAGGYSSLVIDRYHQLVSRGDPALDVSWMDRSGNMITFSDPSLPLVDLFQVSHVAAPERLPTYEAVRGEVVNESCAGQPAAIGSSEPLTGSFSVRSTAINRLDLRFSLAPDVSPTDMVTVHLWEGDRLVLTESTAASTLVEGQPRTFFFAPEQQAPGRTYRWEVQADRPEGGIGLCLDELGNPAVSVYGQDWATAYAGEIVIYERQAPLPRAYVVYGARQVEADGAAVEQLLDPAFPLRRLALTAAPVALPEETSAPLTPAAIRSYEGTRVVIEADAKAPGLLLLGDQYYPGWEARLDGVPVPIIRSNHIFRGVLVPPGKHEVVFSFRPRSLWLGLAGTVLGLLLTAGLALTDRDGSGGPRPLPVARRSRS